MKSLRTSVRKTVLSCAAAVAVVVTLTHCESKNIVASATTNAPTLAASPSVPAQIRTIAKATRIWSLPVIGAPRAVGIYQGTVVVELDSPASVRPSVSTEGIDAQTGKVLWRTPGASPTIDGPPFLALAARVERIDARTGAPSWRSKAVCTATGGTPTNAHISGALVYVGCNTGEIFALRFSDGRVLASAYPIEVAHLNSIIPRGFRTVSVSGYGDAGANTKSAILNGETLSTILASGPDVSYLGYDGGDVITANTCCGGSHDDNWPATIGRISLSSGKQISSVDLLPYEPSLALDQVKPGPGSMLLVGTTLYLSTHQSLFRYDLKNLSAAKLVYDHLSDGPSQIVDNRYFVLRDSTADGASRVRLFDTHLPSGKIVFSDDSTIWFPQTWTPELGLALGLETADSVQTAVVRLKDMTLWEIDPNCRLQTSNGRFVFTLCDTESRRQYVQMYKLP